MFMIIAGVFSLGPRTDCHFDITNERGSRAGNVVRLFLRVSCIEIM